MFPTYQTKIRTFLVNQLTSLKLTYLFGSMTKNTATETSDIDIAVFCGLPIDNLERWRLAQELALQLDRDVDLVDLAACSTVMRMQVVSEGVLLHDKGDFAAEFENVTLSMYQHFNEGRQALVEDKVARILNG